MFPLFATGVVDTSGKFTSGVVNTNLPPIAIHTGGKFAHSINNNSGSSCKFTAGVVDTIGKFATSRKLPPVSLIKVVHRIFRGLGEED